MKKQLATLISGAMLAAAGTASAAEPVALDNAQLDKVTAAGNAAASALAYAFGLVIAATATSTFAYVVAFDPIPTQGGQLLPTLSVAGASSASVSQ